MIRLSRDEPFATDTNYETVLYLGGSMGQEAFKVRKAVEIVTDRFLFRYPPPSY